jgi:aconitate hydratase
MTNPLNTVEQTLALNNKKYTYFSWVPLESTFPKLKLLPRSLKILLENVIRKNCLEKNATGLDDVKAFSEWGTNKKSDHEIAFQPARILMQDFTGVPAVVDLAAMRDARANQEKSPEGVNPLIPVDLVIDHSVMVDHFGTAQAFDSNVDQEFQRNGERYTFLRWGQKAFKNFRVVPPGTGICHQVNLEYLAQVVWTQQDENNRLIVYPDTVFGTDSHTTMVNGLSVLGWGVGGIEAEAAMLGQPMPMIIPDVVGVHITGTLPSGVTATDLVLTVTERLRKQGVVGKFVEFYGPGLDQLTLADRATIANMAPEYGATCGFFPIDAEVINYLRLTARDEETISLVEAYAKAQGIWRESNQEEDLIFSERVELNLNDIEPSIAGPRRPQDRLVLGAIPQNFVEMVKEEFKDKPTAENDLSVAHIQNRKRPLTHGDVAIAAITSCTNTSNPAVMIAAGLLARNARARGLTTAPWVKTSLAPGSQVVTDYLAATGLNTDLDALGFNVVGYGCTTCIGNSGPLSDDVTRQIEERNLIVSAVLSGNRNFEGRINPHVRASYLASPPLVVAMALAGNMNVNLSQDPLGHDPQGNPVFLKDIWPSSQDIQETMTRSVTREMFKKRYSAVFEGPKEWRSLDVPEGKTYAWNSKSTYIQKPPFLEDTSGKINEISIENARPLLILGDSVTTDHISPAGSIKTDSPAGKYLISEGAKPEEFNSYGARRGNHEVMMRGTFANIRLRNAMVPGVSGGVTKHFSADGKSETMSVFDASCKYQTERRPLIVLAGREYGTGSSRDWAAKGTRLLGIRAVIAESFERIHRSNLVGMGVIPMQFEKGITLQSLNLTGEETFNIAAAIKGQALAPQIKALLEIVRPDGKRDSVSLLCRIDTKEEVEYLRAGGVLPFVLNGI